MLPTIRSEFCPDMTLRNVAEQISGIGVTLSVDKASGKVKVSRTPYPPWESTVYGKHSKKCWELELLPCATTLQLYHGTLLGAERCVSKGHLRSGVDRQWTWPHTRVFERVAKSHFLL